MINLLTLQLIEDCLKAQDTIGNTFEQNARNHHNLEMLLYAHLPELVALARKGLGVS